MFEVCYKYIFELLDPSNSCFGGSQLNEIDIILNLSNISYVTLIVLWNIVSPNDDVILK
jgi:hypothetical protein